MKIQSVTDVITNSSSEVLLAVVDKNPVLDLPDGGVACVVKITQEWIKLKLKEDFYFITSVLQIPPNNPKFFESGYTYYNQKCIKTGGKKWPVERKIEEFMKNYESRISPFVGKYFLMINQRDFGEFKAYVQVKRDITTQAGPTMWWTSLD